MKYFLALSTILLITFQVSAQGDLWNGRSCAVVLTYDDGLNEHLDKVIPSLDSAGLHGTFYIPGNAVTISKRMNDWRKAALNGHELGNHSLFHPCSGSPAGRVWVNPDYDLDKYSVRRFMDEIKVSNTILSMIDGRTVRTFAYTCGDMKAGTDSFYEELKDEFPSARGVISRYESHNPDLFNVGAFTINGQTGEQMIRMVQEAMKSGSLLVFLFHGVGGEFSLNVSLEDHTELVRFLKENLSDVWVPTFLELSEYLIEKRN